MTQPPGGTGPAGDALLNVSRLSAAVNGKRLVTGGGFDLRPGEIVGLLGESGSGKTLIGLSVLGQDLLTTPRLRASATT
jgi:ABC-type glutathione transport system ATPase component